MLTRHILDNWIYSTLIPLFYFVIKMFTGRWRMMIFVSREITVIGHFAVVCLLTWPLSGSDAGGDLVLIQTLLLFTCKSCCSHDN